MLLFIYYTSQLIFYTIQVIYVRYIYSKYVRALLRVSNIDFKIHKIF